MPRLSCAEAKFRLEAIRSEMDGISDEIAEYGKTGDSSAEYRITNSEVRIQQMVKELREGMGMSFERAREILGKDFLGPEAVEKTWKLKLEAKDIPPIPFSIEDLERAKELGQFLILRTSLTMQKMEELTKEPVFRDDWFKQEEFYTKDASKAGWALITKEVIPDSTNKNYLEQTEVLIDYLMRNEVFVNQEMPEIYQNAILEFEAKKQDLKKLMESNWQEASKQLSELQITKLLRQSPADVIHDLLVYKQNNDERLLENIYTWTSARSSDGGLVSVGNFKPDGADVSDWEPDDADDELGVAFVRSQ